VNGWVIGGTSGIGAACAELMQKEMQVTSTGLREGDWDVRRQRPGLIAEMGYPTHIVYSAGINHLDWIGQGVVDHADVIDVNLVGFLRLMNSLVLEGQMSNTHERGHYPFGMLPSVVVVSSDAAERPLRTSIGYCASKAGLNMAVRVAARELGPHGWRINAVSPGMTNDTGMQQYVDERVQKVRGWDWGQMMDYEVQQAVTPGRITPDQVAEVVYSTLMGPSHLNGSIITLNGGR
jgi:NAD(P)-dependent dehydrogenase (short-subunit alcohol dehydrogenase family)